MVKMMTGAEAGRQRGARRRNQTESDSGSTFRLHRRQMIARYGLAGLVAKVTPKTMTPPPPPSPMSFFDALNKAKAATEAEKAREGDAPRAQTTT